MAAMPPGLLPRIHPFWLTLGVGMAYGYAIRKYELDKRVIEAMHHRRDALLRHEANILLDEVEKRKIISTLPEAPKVSRGIET